MEIKCSASPQQVFGFLVTYQQSMCSGATSHHASVTCTMNEDTSSNWKELRRWLVSGEILSFLGLFHDFSGYIKSKNIKEKDLCKMRILVYGRPLEFQRGLLLDDSEKKKFGTTLISAAVPRVSTSISFLVSLFPCFLEQYIQPSNRVPSTVLLSTCCFWPLLFPPDTTSAVLKVQNPPLIRRCRNGRRRTQSARIKSRRRHKQGNVSFATCTRRDGSPWESRRLRPSYPPTPSIHNASAPGMPLTRGDIYFSYIKGCNPC